MYIYLDINLSAIPKEILKKATNGATYCKLYLSKMRQPDKYGNEYTIYAKPDKDAERIYVGKGKEYGQQQALPAAQDFPADMPF